MLRDFSTNRYRLFVQCDKPKYKELLILNKYVLNSNKQR